MTTSLVNAMTALSKDLNDYWAGTTTGAGSATTLVDTALMAKANDWITDYAYAFLTEEPTGSAAIYDERKISSLDNSTGTLTTLTFAAAPGSGIDYQVHRLWSPTEKAVALCQAAKLVYPHLFSKVRDETRTAGNWLRNGDVETWTSTSYPDYWRAQTVTAAADTTARLFTRGSTSCKLSTAAGYLYQDWGLNDELKYLRGRTVTFKGRLHCDTASALRLAVYDGTDTTYSEYHPGGSYWDNEHETISVSAYIDPEATEVEFRVCLESATATAYVDNLQVLTGDYLKVYVGDLLLAQDRPHMVYYNTDWGVVSSPWLPLRNYHIETDGWMYLGENHDGARLRIEGTGYLDFLASGVSSTSWTATIAVDEPQLQILSAEAACWLYSQMSMPNYTTGERKAYQESLAYWQGELQRRINKFAFKSPSIQIDWGL